MADWTHALGALLPADPREDGDTDAARDASPARVRLALLQPALQLDLVDGRRPKRPPMLRARPVVPGHGRVGWRVGRHVMGGDRVRPPGRPAGGAAASAACSSSFSALLGAGAPTDRQYLQTPSLARPRRDRQPAGVGPAVRAPRPAVCPSSHRGGRRAAASCPRSRGSALLDVRTVPRRPRRGVLRWVTGTGGRARPTRSASPTRSPWPGGRMAGTPAGERCRTCTWLRCRRRWCPAPAGTSAASRRCRCPPVTSTVSPPSTCRGSPTRSALRLPRRA